ncbi:unnamed protein product [Trichogramma brassicae]|uniref:C2H2-type domain-containing protein n=1 Tax=Trichogramma brassicae TaxID=86971 RepID=A0A6H5I3Y2_9HYME|nr:unnamed protein product [Trichogramma brassicae]
MAARKSETYSRMKRSDLHDPVLGEARSAGACVQGAPGDRSAVHLRQVRRRLRHQRRSAPASLQLARAQIRLRRVPAEIRQGRLSAPAQGPGASALEALHLRPVHQGVTRKDNLRQHVSLVHLGVKKYRCGQCEQSFGWRSTLTFHFASVHLAPKFGCDECGKKFGLRNHLRRHVESVHLGMKYHKCPQCPRQFARKDNMETHRMNIHHTPYASARSHYHAAKTSHQDHDWMRHNVTQIFLL